MKYELSQWEICEAIEQWLSKQIGSLPAEAKFKHLFNVFPSDSDEKINCVTEVIRDVA